MYLKTEKSCDNVAMLFPFTGNYKIKKGTRFFYWLAHLSLFMKAARLTEDACLFCVDRYSDRFGHNIFAAISIFLLSLVVLYFINRGIHYTLTRLPYFRAD